MALKKSELYSSLWSSCDELRGGMDASQYKDYVLVLLFVKYVSDKYAGVAYAPIEIPKGASFKDMVALKGKPDIGDQINKKIIGPLARENKLSDMPDFNDATKLGSGKEMVERLTNLIGIFENKAGVTARLKEIKGDKDAKDELAALGAWIKLAEQEADRKRALKEAEAELDAKALAKYPTLKEAEVKTLVVEDKWLAALAAAVHGEMERISQGLTKRLRELAERYEMALPQAVEKVAEFEQAVTRHLARMGFTRV